jgi:hypothetical protein
MVGWRLLAWAYGGVGDDGSTTFWRFFLKKIARRPTGTTGIYIRTQAIEFR